MEVKTTIIPDLLGHRIIYFIGSVCHEEGEDSPYGMSYSCVAPKNVKGENLPYTGQCIDKCSHDRFYYVQKTKITKSTEMDETPAFGSIINSDLN